MSGGREDEWVRRGDDSDTWVDGKCVEDNGDVGTGEEEGGGREEALLSRGDDSAVWVDGTGEGGATSPLRESEERELDEKEAGREDAESEEGSKEGNDEEEERGEAS